MDKGISNFMPLSESEELMKLEEKRLSDYIGKIRGPATSHTIDCEPQHKSRGNPRAEHNHRRWCLLQGDPNERPDQNKQVPCILPRKRHCQAEQRCNY